MHNLFGRMDLTLACEMRGSQIIKRILDSLRMTTITFYLVSVSCFSFIRDFGSVTLLFSGTSISSV
jgi:hypothetical protein